MTVVFSSNSYSDADVVTSTVPVYVPGRAEMVRVTASLPRAVPSDGVMTRVFDPSERVVLPFIISTTTTPARSFSDTIDTDTTSCPLSWPPSEMSERLNLIAPRTSFIEMVIASGSVISPRETGEPTFAFTTLALPATAEGRLTVNFPSAVVGEYG